RALAPDRAHERDPGRRTEPAAAATGDLETCRLPGDGEIAGGDELAAGRRRQALHLGDDRLRRALQRLHDLAAQLEERSHRREVAPLHVGEIVAGAEYGTPCGHDDAASRRRSGLPDRLAQLEEMRLGECVSALGPRHRDDGEVALAGERDVLEAHAPRVPLASSSPPLDCSLMSHPSSLLRAPVAALPRLHQIVLPTPWEVGPVQIYVIEDDPLTLIDTGVARPESRMALGAAFEQLGLELEQVRRVVL